MLKSNKAFSNFADPFDVLLLSDCRFTSAFLAWSYSIFPRSKYATEFSGFSLIDVVMKSSADLFFPEFL
ncbi:MAG: hypothetical protein HWD59_11185 [Coxiellaceae bacterium]|nr:MAG: hypothetical protein HWD59_11185 [Coxiellaceae bacterium]